MGFVEKYHYKGGSLRQYCLNNYIMYEYIIYRISKLSKINPNLTIDEMIEISLNDNLYKKELYDSKNSKKMR